MKDHILSFKAFQCTYAAVRMSKAHEKPQLRLALHLQRLTKPGHRHYRYQSKAFDHSLSRKISVRTYVYVAARHYIRSYN